MLSAGFRIGSSYAKEAAISGVYLANWGSIANRLRRKSPTQALRPFQGRLGESFYIGSSNVKEAASRRVPRLLGELRSPRPEENARGGSPPRRETAVGPADRGLPALALSI